MEQNAETMFAGNTLHDRHQQHVVVDGQIGLLEDGRQFELVGGYLVVTGLYGDA